MPPIMYGPSTDTLVAVNGVAIARASIDHVFDRLAGWFWPDVGASTLTDVEPK